MPVSHTPALATEFEQLVGQLHLTKETYKTSRKLYTWCRHNKNRVYVPEWLLEEWNLTVDMTFNTAA
jgi:hypothetical protein